MIDARKIKWHKDAGLVRSDLSQQLSYTIFKLRLADGFLVQSYICLALIRVLQHLTRHCESIVLGWSSVYLGARRYRRLKMPLVGAGWVRNRMVGPSSTA